MSVGDGTAGQLSSAGPTPRPTTLEGVAKRDPHVVLGVERGATPAQIKAAWRRLARSNHPDLTGDDPTAVQAATRRMAEINDAYAALTREAAADRRVREGERADFGAGVAPRRGGPPRPKPTRPVTRTLDMSGTFRQRHPGSRNGSGAAPAASGGAGGAAGPAIDGGTEAATARRATPLTGQPPLRGERVRGEPPRASTPTGPLERGRLRHFRRPKPPSLEAAREHMMEFGKFHGHTLGQIAGFEPSYIDWVAGTVTRDPELVAAARVVQADLDTRGVSRRSHPTPVRAGRTA
jgi:curved DNA-binding protein CbpA